MASKNESKVNLDYLWAIFAILNSIYGLSEFQVKILAENAKNLGNKPLHRP